LNATWLALAQHQLGRDADAVATLEQALAWSVAGPQVPAELMVRAELARILPTMGAVDEGAAHLARCDEILSAREDWRGRAGQVELARGAVAAARGESRLAASAYEAAVRCFAAFQLPWHQALALRDWSDRLASAGSLADAEAMRARARELYAGLGAGQRWQRRLLQADASPGVAKAEPELLTARERQVLRLVAEGLSDREIAERLVLSPHTIHRHVANIRTKLGQSSRAAAVAHATRHNLA
jgi:ATP/maltotriose-dependent transcriptional regulator MalT